MELLETIEDKDFPKNELELKIREASRAILFDEKGLTPLLFVKKHAYHKLPGGGIDDEESKIEALIRECLEEVGSEIEVDGEVGKIIEFRLKWNLKQISYCYYGKVISKGNPDFTKKELNQGFEIIWVPLETAILKVENDKPKNYEGSFIQKRDLIFLKKALQKTSL